MSAAGDRRPGGVPTEASTDPAGPEPGANGDPRSMLVTSLLAIVVALLAAVAWASLRGVLDLGMGLVAVAVLGGWGIGATVRSGRGPTYLALLIAAGAWLLGLVFTWLVSMAILPGSTRTFFERIEATPFTDWMSPQFGLLEIVGLVAYLAAAIYATRRRGATSRR